MPLARRCVNLTVEENFLNVMEMLKDKGYKYSALCEFGLKDKFIEVFGEKAFECVMAGNTYDDVEKRCIPKRVKMRNQDLK